MVSNERIRVDIAGQAAAPLEITEHRPADASGFVRASFASLAAPFVYLRQYPPVLATLRATIGSVQQLGVREEDVVREAVIFRGSHTARTAKLVTSGLQVEFAGTTFDAAGNALAVSIAADAAGNLKASRPFWGAAIVSYSTQYRLLKYNYEVEIREEPGFGNGGTRITGGTVLAFHAGEVASFDLPAPELPQAEPNQAEIYRKVSYTILQAQDEYERPDDWPNATWPGGDPDPDEGWIENERTHEIGWMDGYGRVSIDSNPVKPAQPFIGTSNYTIPVETTVASNEQLTGQGFSEAAIAQARAQLQDLGIG